MYIECTLSYIMCGLFYSPKNRALLDCWTLYPCQNVTELKLHSKKHRTLEILKMSVWIDVFDCAPAQSRVWLGSPVSGSVSVCVTVDERDK